MGTLAVTPRTPLYRGDQLLGLVQGVFDVSAILKGVLTGADLRFAAQLHDANGNRFWGVEMFSGETRTLPVQVGDNAWALSVGWRSPAPGPVTAKMRRDAKGQVLHRGICVIARPDPAACAFVRRVKSCIEAFASLQDLTPLLLPLHHCKT